MNELNPVRSTTLKVTQEAEEVKINIDAIESLATTWKKADIQIPPWSQKLHLDADNELSILDYLIVLDTLNFCFWNGNNGDRWKIIYKRSVYDGYCALALALKEFFEDYPEKATLRYLAKISFEEFKDVVLQGGNDLLFLQERWEMLQNVCQYITQQYGSSRSFVRSGNNKLSILIPKIANELPSFDDVSYYQDETIYLWKRAQILAIDIHAAFGGKGLGYFQDLEYATAFADYKLPQILAHFGVLEYTTDLREKIENHELLPAGSRKELEIRSATIWAVEYLKEALGRFGNQFHSFEVDWILWNKSQKMTMQIPHHNTQTISY